MKQSWIAMSILIAGGVYASWYAFVSTHNPCVWDRSYECLFGQDEVQIAELTWQTLTWQDLSTPDTSEQIVVISTQNQLSQSTSVQSDTPDTILAAQEAAALEKQQAATLAAQQAAALAAQQANKNRDDDHEEEDDD